MGGLSVFGRASLALVVLAGVAAACGAQQPRSDEAVARTIARQVIPAVERAVGLTFKRAPDIEVRSRAQLRSYLEHKLATELPPAELHAVERAYRAFGLIPDTLHLQRLMLALYDEQVAGYYDPDSSALFVVRGADSMAVRLIMAHELVHALQDEYTPLNAILKLKRQNDRQMAGQAVAEGQATLASIEALAPGTDAGRLMGDWDAIRELIRSQRAAMPVFSSAPLIIQESLLFPYVAGFRFMEAFDRHRTRPDEEPYGARMPLSTAQILHYPLYAAGHLPERVVFGPAPRGDTLVYDDDFGEFETRVALEAWGIDEQVADVAATGWDGDRFEVLGAPPGTALLWVTLWMTPADADQFQRAVTTGWGRRTGTPGRTLRAGGGAGAAYRAGRAERRWRVVRLTVGGEQAVRLVDAPARWAGWERPPAATASRLKR